MFNFKINAAQRLTAANAEYDKVHEVVRTVFGRGSDTQTQLKGGRYESFRDNDIGVSISEEGHEVELRASSPRLKGGPIVVRGHDGHSLGKALKSELDAHPERLKQVPMSGRKKLQTISQRLGG